MVSLNLTIKQKNKKTHKRVVELDMDQFEKLAAMFGFFSDEFLKDMEESEKDYKAGRVKGLKSLRDLR